MVKIDTILVQIVTHDIDWAGTDGHVYLGIGGREFYIDSKSEVLTDFDDFERKSDRHYLLGSYPNYDPTPDLHKVLYKEHNNPQKPFYLDTDTLDSFPVYIRFEPAGNHPDWALKSVKVRVNPTSDSNEYKQYRAPQTEDEYIWLGQYVGKVVYLLPYIGVDRPGSGVK